ncbi:hypothetical protein FQN50_007558 [Emmonsiellopsis sp. PD_5]|nr:hypothetical protein FQN50_007558 [Emmonsiellopsis sp. PD_5]
MAPTKVFVTGATGYIGGDGLYAIAQAHPDWEITALVRTKEKGEEVARQYPSVTLVYGDLDSADLLEREAAKADIIYRKLVLLRRMPRFSSYSNQFLRPDFADSDHVGAAKAIAKGISSHTPDRPGYWIHTSGTGMLTYEDDLNLIFGELRPKEYNDWDGITELTSFHDDALHRDVDKIVLEVGTSASDRVKTAIVAPPCIYGPGRGPSNRRSYQIYNLAKTVLKRKRGIQVGKGQNIWHQVHIEDLSDLYLSLGEEAAESRGNATWGRDGYYFADNGPFVWGDIQKAVAEAAFAKGLVPSSDPEILDGTQTEAEFTAGAHAWGTNSRGHALRARKLLGWNPHRPVVFDLIPSIVEGEAKDLGLI